MGAFAAVIRVRDAGSATDNAPTFIGAVITFVADADQGGGSDVTITNHALAIALFTQAADGDPGLLPAHHKVGMMLGHG